LAIPILHLWEKYFYDYHEGLGSTYERFIINELLVSIVNQFNIKTVFESPSFGFTGLSGINSLGLAINGINVTIADNNHTRLIKIREVWSQFNTTANFILENEANDLMIIKEYFNNLSNINKKKNINHNFDMSWNFSALWFVKDIELFLNELSNITTKAILIIVPNRTGIGYLHQSQKGKNDFKNLLIEKNIVPDTFISILKNLNWKLIKSDYIDCPLWPDIGMEKEDFLKTFITRKKKITNRKRKNKKPLSIIDYYTGKSPNMKTKMLKLDFFEKFAPNVFKKIWAHHKYFLSVKGS